MTLKEQLTEAMKTAMRAKDSQRLGVIRLMLAACKQVEVDERIELDDNRVLVILDKMTKQRRESLKQYEDAKREDLAEQERFEIAVIAEFLPAALSAAEIEAIVSKAIAETGASDIRDMGKVMAIVKPQIQGRGDLSAVSQSIKKQLQ